MHIIFIEVMLNQADKYKQHEDVYMFLVHTEYTSTHTQLDPRISFFFLDNVLVILPMSCRSVQCVCIKVLLRVYGIYLCPLSGQRFVSIIIHTHTHTRIHIPMYGVA